MRSWRRRWGKRIENPPLLVTGTFAYLVLTLLRGRVYETPLHAFSFHPAHADHRTGPADIIDDTIGNIQQAINDASNPDRGRDYEDSRDDGWQREVSDDRRRQYDDRRRQFEDRRRQLDDRQHQLNQERRQLEDEERRMEDEYGQ